MKRKRNAKYVGIKEKTEKICWKGRLDEEKSVTERESNMDIG